MLRKLCILLLVNFLLVTSYSQKKTGTEKNEILNAMKKASAYMVNTLSCNGGYLWFYEKNLKEQYGEIPARKSQIWVQGRGGTPAMGELFIDMYTATGEDIFLDYSKKVAQALIYGQHPSGGWHYFIDFDKPGLEQWYKDTASQYIVGWEEFRHYYGNCTYDDDVTQSATRFLLHLYNTTLDPSIHCSLMKALDFILTSQYPNGGWPQRYPLRYEYAHDGLPDYTSFYTLNDNAMNSTIDVLLEAYGILGDERYLEAAKRGADFFMISQGPEDHAGWADQFGMDLKPATGRTHEPAAYQVRYTLSTIQELEKLFLVTGDRRYLRPIPLALDWMESSITGIDENGRPEFAEWYDPETNYPIIREVLPEVNEEGYMKYKYTVDTTVTFIDFKGKLTFREQYETISNVEPGKEREMLKNFERRRNFGRNNADEKNIKKLLQTMDEQGRWIEKITVHDIEHTMDQNFDAVLAKGFYRYAVKEIDGISTFTYIKNMQSFIHYIEH